MYNVELAQAAGLTLASSVIHPKCSSRTDLRPVLTLPTMHTWQALVQKCATVEQHKRYGLSLSR